MTGLYQCVFCQQFSPDDAHMETHNYGACQEKTDLERTFYRKDHLRQHLKLMHGVKYDPHMETWRSTTFEVRSRCGFCPSQFVSWQQRADHLAAHFRNGCDMMQWTGTHGFEAHVENLVENFIPPYLVGHERQTMDPFVARPRNIVDEYTGGDDVDLLNRDSNCWGRLESELANYVAEQKALGVVPTDKMLQDHARLQIYGTVDEWDWTAADNQVWLNAFRCEQGIGHDSTPEYTETRAVPLHAPYVVKGGIKTKKITSANHMDSTSVPRRSRSRLPTARSRRTHSGLSSGPLSGAPLTPNDNFNFDLDLPSVYDASDMPIDLNNIGLDDLSLESYVESGVLRSNPAILSAEMEADYTPLTLQTDMDQSDRSNQHRYTSPHEVNEHGTTLAAFDQLVNYVQSSPDAR